MLQTCLVVAGGGQVRNSDLLRQVAEAGLAVEIVSAPLANDIPATHAALDRLFEVLVYGRRLTRGEMACTQGHYLALQRATELQENVVLVVEDDVDLLATRNELEAWTQAALAHDPVVVTLHPQGRVIQESDPADGLMRLRAPSPGTVAYLTSKGAALIACSAGPPGHQKSDWPGWIGHVRFMSTLESKVALTDGPSLIGDRAPLRIWFLVPRSLALLLAVPFFVRPGYFLGALRAYFRAVVASPLLSRQPGATAGDRSKVHRPSGNVND